MSTQNHTNNKHVIHPEPTMLNRNATRRLIPGICMWMLLFACAPVRAGYLDDIGYTRLAAELGASLPDGSGVTVTQAEASTSG
ncbi:MAG TPA: hypothetical protein VET88_16275, partial [Gammaproteobacteria bacterium]|nr:hypothetical protein [Gammaproteobacteria bacterium]